MLGINDLEKGTIIIYNNEPHEILEAKHLVMQQRKPVLQARLKNLVNGKVFEKNFQHSEVFEEAEIEKLKVEFLYQHRGEYWFCEENNPANRFKLDEKLIGERKNFLKPKVSLTAFRFQGKIINIVLPIKMDFRVIEAPPGIRGDTAQGGSKVVVIETGAKITTPLFIETGDIIRINTENGEYVERVGKA